MATYGIFKKFVYLIHNKNYIIEIFFKHPFLLVLKVFSILLDLTQILSQYLILRKHLNYAFSLFSCIRHPRPSQNRHQSRQHTLDYKEKQ